MTVSPDSASGSHTHAGSAVRIRLAQESDAPALAALRWEFRAEGGEPPAVPYAEFSAHYAAFFQAGLAGGERGHVVAEDADGALLGHTVCQVVPLVPRPCRLNDACGVITDNYVRPAYRDRGVGAALLAGIVEWARTRELETVIVWPSDRARPFYARHGFSDRSEVMELVLRPPGDSPAPVV
jgi:GNAT superfamily N-acetyltransferase